ncbi:Methyl-accepting chemotaxis protein [plant metagenome]|uniref:Methyl-accepting chemotaxis protein n=1 Tax=plant metagenome TaxID=1297885 RepID=A0A484SF76_9ZZZZ
MTGVPHASRSTATLVLQLLLWAWLIALSVATVISFRVAGDLAGRQQLDAAQAQVKQLDTRVAELAEAIEALQAMPEAATAAALHGIRQSLDARLGQIEQALSERATTDALTAVRSELDLVKARQAARSSATAQLRSTRPAAADAQEEPIPFQVIGAELRAGQRSLSVAPAGVGWSPAQIQVVLPGETVGQWRLDAIDGKTAVFRLGEQTRRLAIP